MQTLNNTAQLSEATAEFTCSEARQKGWDGVLTTGGYSPRNEAFIHAQKFVDMWRKFNRGSYPHSKSSPKICTTFTC